MLQRWHAHTGGHFALHVASQGPGGDCWGACPIIMDIALKPRNPGTGCWLMMSVLVHVYSFYRLSLVLLFDLQRCVISAVWIHSGEFKDKDKEEDYGFQDCWVGITLCTCPFRPVNTLGHVHFFNNMIDCGYG